MGKYDRITVIEQFPSKYKLKLKYGGFFQYAKNSSRRKYCFGFQKSFYMETCSYNLNQLVEDVENHYPSQSDAQLSIVFEDRDVKDQTFIELNSYDNFTLMLSMYEHEKEITIYATRDNNIPESHQHDEENEVTHEPDDDNDSESCASEESYHSRHSTDGENDSLSYDGRTYSYNKKGSTMKVGSKFPNVVAFRRALNHYAITNEFEYAIEKNDLTRLRACCSTLTCDWKILASTLEDKVTFEVKKFVDLHTCTQSNKCGNRHATQGWIADVVGDMLKSDGDVSLAELKKILMKNYNVDVPYLRVVRGKEQAYIDI